MNGWTVTECEYVKRREREWERKREPSYCKWRLKVACSSIDHSLETAPVEYILCCLKQQRKKKQINAIFSSWFGCGEILFKKIVEQNKKKSISISKNKVKYFRRK